MHNNYYFLKQLSARLALNLDGFSLVSCFSQHKDELVLEFNNTLRSFFIKASLSPEFSCLSFPDSFNRARKNSVDLFNDLLLKKVAGVYQFENERSFSILLEMGFQLIFKMHGNRANVLLIQHDQVREIFKNQLETDFEIDIKKNDRQIDWSREEFDAHLSNLSSLYFTFGKEVWKYLNNQGFEVSEPDQKWNLIQDVLGKLNHPEFYLIQHNNQLIFSLVSLGSVLKKYDDPVKAINNFFNQYISSSTFLSEKNSALKLLRDKLSSAESYIAKNQQKLSELENNHHYQQWADLIMANLHRVKTGEEKLITENFYNENKPIEIKLKKEFSAQKNAEFFYRKSKNQHIEIEKLKEAIGKKEKEAGKLQKTIQETESLSELKSLRKNSDIIALQSQKEKEKTALPFYEFQFKGYKIWVGRSAESNDELTLKYSFKEDLWLHVKDVPGSHVLIKHQAGKNFPKDVIERAAELAAYNSKRRTETLCAVIFTPKKYVRKRKGDPAGAMVVEKEEVILVEPKLEVGG